MSLKGQITPKLKLSLFTFMSLQTVIIAHKSYHIVRNVIKFCVLFTASLLLNVNSMTKCFNYL